MFNFNNAEVFSNIGSRLLEKAKNMEKMTNQKDLDRPIAKNIIVFDEGRGKNENNELLKKFDPRTKNTLECDVSSAAQNKIDGRRRENEVAKELKEKYPEEEGYKVLRERELCDKGGKPVIDEQTGKKRRVDFVVVKDGKVVDMVEVTSKTASKRDQLAKEARIRDNGGNYIKDCDGNIYRIPDNVKTRVERRD